MGIRIVDFDYRLGLGLRDQDLGLIHRNLGGRLGLVVMMIGTRV